MKNDQTELQPIENTPQLKDEATLLISQAIDGRGNHPNSRRNLELGKHISVSKEKNGNWHGDKANYAAFHKWLKYNFGAANTCENPTCKYPRKIRRGTSKKLVFKPYTYHWALKRGKKYSHTRKDYLQLCITCHRLYDNGTMTINI